jgi:hypothetical protein
VCREDWHEARSGVRPVSISSFGHRQNIQPPSGNRKNSDDPILLERIYRQLRHADRIILAFDDPTERAAWAHFVRLIGIDGELIEPDLQDITVLGVNHFGGTPTLVVARRGLNFGERAVKRVLDLAISMVNSAQFRRQYGPVYRQ